MPAQLGVKEVKSYPIIVEKTRTGYSPHSPNLDGCVATGKTREGAERRMREAIVFHLEGIAAIQRDRLSSRSRKP